MHVCLIVFAQLCIVCYIAPSRSWDMQNCLQSFKGNLALMLFGAVIQSLYVKQLCYVDWYEVRLGMCLQHETDT